VGNGVDLVTGKVQHPADRGAIAAVDPLQSPPPPLRTCARIQ